MLQSLWNLFSGILGSIWGLLVSILVFAQELLIWLHVESPRLEGLLVGVLLAWFMMKRESHPILKMLSAPLKLTLDILDLAWDHGVEFVLDGVGTVKNWVSGSWQWSKEKVSSLYTGVMNKLRKTKKDLQD